MEKEHCYSEIVNQRCLTLSLHAAQFPSYCQKLGAKWSFPAENLGNLMLVFGNSQGENHSGHCPERRNNGSAWAIWDLLRMSAPNIVLFPSGPVVSGDIIRRPIRSYLCLACCYSRVASRQLPLDSRRYCVVLQGRGGTYRDCDCFFFRRSYPFPM
ncbi:hypothetical protein BDW69DRAFT_163581, partial [Aspergillus filifer]